jgi:hypothetical protein
MVYLILILSLTANGILVWYVRKLLQKYWFDVDVREKFTEMLGQYAESLNSLYRLEELYGEETIKRAITQTEFVIEACKEFKEAIDTATPRQQSDEYEPEEAGAQEAVIKLREGERVTQTAANYKRVITE